MSFAFALSPQCLVYPILPLSPSHGAYSTYMPPSTLSYLLQFASTHIAREFPPCLNTPTPHLMINVSIPPFQFTHGLYFCLFIYCVDECGTNKVEIQDRSVTFHVILAWTIHVHHMTSCIVDFLEYAVFKVMII